MGLLWAFDLPALVETFGLRRLVETGTGRGDSLAYAAAIHNSDGVPLFSQLISCEIIPVLAQQACERFRLERRIEIINSPSEMFLFTVLHEIPQDEPVLFWLDAHFPGADSFLAAWGDETNPAVRLPAVRELDVIKKYRPLNQDVILMDDARIWLDEPFIEGLLPDDVRPFCPAERNIDFIHERFSQSHDIKVMLQHHGYVVLTPTSAHTADTTAATAPSAAPA